MCLRADFQYGWLSDNRHTFEQYLLARSFHTMPRPGGLDQQEPKKMQMFIVLDLIERGVNKQAELVMLKGLSRG